MSDIALLMIGGLLGGLIVAAVYLTHTVQRHERTLLYHQEELQRHTSIASWGELSGDE